MEKLTMTISSSLAENNFIKHDEIDIYRYGIEMFIICVLEMAAVLLLSVIVGNSPETVCYLLGFIPIRMYSGGYHADTRLRCFIIFLAVYVLFSIVNTYPILPQLGIPAIGIAMANIVIVYILAPLPNGNKSIKGKEKAVYRKRGLIFSCVAAVIVILSVVSKTYNIGIQAFLLGLFSAFISLIVGKIKNTVKEKRING